MTRLARTIGTMLASAVAIASATTAAQAQGVVEKIKQRGYIICGASQGVPGMSLPDEKGVWSGYDVDICRAVAVAILGDREKVRFVPLNAAQRLPAIQTGEIDILSRTTTITYSRDTAVRFAARSQYDNDGLLIRKSLGVKAKKQLDGLTVCLQGGGSLTEQAIDEVEEDEKIKMRRVYFDSTIQARDAYFAGRCDSYVTDGVAAAGQRAKVAKNPDEHDIIVVGHAAEPNGVAIARGDDQMFDIVRWTWNLLVWAEDHGITQKNVDEKLKTEKKEEKRVLGLANDGFGKPLKLDDKWAYNVIKQVGNLSEIWERNVGETTPLKVPRGMNALHRNGGVNFPLPWN